jgi:minimal PKS acyl carrier protein
MAQEWTAEGLLDMLTEKAGLARSDRPATLDVTFREIGLDSLAYLQLETVVAERFGVELPADGAETDTLAVILDRVNSALAERAVR